MGIQDGAAQGRIVGLANVEVEGRGRMQSADDRVMPWSISTGVSRAVVNDIENNYLR